jgi:hypothetical protein
MDVALGEGGDICLAAVHVPCVFQHFDGGPDDVRHPEILRGLGRVGREAAIVAGELGRVQIVALDKVDARLVGYLNVKQQLPLKSLSLK